MAKISFITRKIQEQNETDKTIGGDGPYTKHPDAR